MVNKVILIGNLGRDPELSYTASGVAIAKVSLATTEKWTDRDGNRKEQTEWHNLVFWRRQAEVANEYLRTGSRIFVEGRIRYRSWEGQDGQKKYATDIEVQNFQMLSSRGESGGGQNRQRSSGQQNQQQRPQQQQQGGSGQQNRQQQQPREDGETHYEPYNQGGGGGDQFGSSNDDDLPF